MTGEASRPNRPNPLDALLGVSPRRQAADDCQREQRLSHVNSRRSATDFFLGVGVAR